MIGKIILVAGLISLGSSFWWLAELIAQCQAYPHSPDPSHGYVQYVRGWISDTYYFVPVSLYYHYNLARTAFALSLPLAAAGVYLNW